MNTPVAVLPMYDWPEVRSATDALWCALRDAFRSAGIAAPDELERSATFPDVLQSASLTLGQTCGLPYVHGLRDRVTLLGTPDYGVPGCAPGEYRSAIVVRADDPRENLIDFKDSCFVLNADNSQSGYAAMLYELVPLCGEDPFFSQRVTSGGHAASIKCVNTGKADIAAIDYVTWKLARRYMPEAAALREIALTAPIPGLPLVAAKGCDLAMMQELVAGVYARLDNEISEQLNIEQFVPMVPNDYDVVSSHFEIASKAVRLA